MDEDVVTEVVSFRWRGVIISVILGAVLWWMILEAW